MYPVKVYDKHGNLIKEYTQDELDKRSEEMFKNNTHNKKKSMHWRTAKAQKEMKQRSETNNELFAYKGDKQCKSVPLNLKSGEVPHSGKSKDTTGEPEKE
tara:strand:- start:220 stop:519 length:300 start_codon:yes stop_codon:yes gene_type:complete